MTGGNRLNDLFAADPELARRVAAELDAPDVVALSPHMADFIADTIWGLSLETHFGTKVASGYVALAKSGCAHQAPQYHRWVRKFGGSGPELGGIMAETLVYVLKLDSPVILEQFLDASGIMLKKGTYTLYGPFEALAAMCRQKDVQSIPPYLDLLADAFSLNLTYKQCRPLTYLLPKAVLKFSPRKRPFQILQLGRVIRADLGLVDSFLDGMSKGLDLLTQEALFDFVSEGLSGRERNRKRCAKFLSLDSSLGRRAFEARQVAAALSQMRPSLGQYVNARTGRRISIRGIPAGDAEEDASGVWTYSDGRSIWLPVEITRYADREKNAALFKHLAKMEAGFFEFGTFDFDLEKLASRREGAPVDKPSRADGDSDVAVFLNGFGVPAMAADLFTLFEHGRIKDLTKAKYPGLIRRTLPAFQAEAARITAGDGPLPLLQLLYHVIALDLAEGVNEGGRRHAAAQRIIRAYREKMSRDPVVETSAELVALAYPVIERQYSRGAAEEMVGLKTPFNRKVDPGGYFSAFSAVDKAAALIQSTLRGKGVRVYRSDVRRHLLDHGGITPSDVREIALTPSDGRHSGDPAGKVQIDLSDVEISGILSDAGVAAVPAPDTGGGPARFYKEWDSRLGDYLHRHTCVRERVIPERDSDFYRKTLDRHRGLVSRIRYAFELLKPEGIAILRQWVEGDAFDYRALLDFVLDRKAGIMPSDRLYIKRIKQHRDVAVLVLVDLSRSTANAVATSAASVLDVEKEAIVLFCEALEVVGDRYAVAGFSGTGRLGVDYFRIKDFTDELDAGARGRINAMSPQRSTRMGAAIRHAAFQLEDVDAGVKLLIIIGDGFPNDVDYKKEYALEDTRKAIAEARSKNIHTHGLTVNISADPKLDDLYGRVRHHVISDVRELPDRLPRIYSTLTRY